MGNSGFSKTLKLIGDTLAVSLLAFIAVHFIALIVLCLGAKMTGLIA
jgi:hypothetical protein